MQEPRTILICDNDTQRAHELTTVLKFIGESSEICESSVVQERIKAGGEFVAIISPSVMDANSLIEQFLAVPFLVIGDDNSIKGQGNLIGSVAQPFAYEHLTQQLHHCLTYLTQLPTKNAAPRSERLRQNLVGKGIAIQEVRHLIEQVANKDANVLILGESGTGKEVVAQAIHDHSPRAEGPFVPINCGAIPADLLESELFGHEKGAFTGAFAMRKGRFELAAGGTLFLDEIGDMPMPMQVKLLRVLQERSFERVGGVKPIKADVRIIAATHRQLETMIEKELFREDLYYRLNVFPIEMPSLRERQDDIPLLLQELVNRHEDEHGAVVRFTQRAIESLMAHQWPGNVRELSNLIERLLILHPNQIVDVSDLPPKYRHIDAPAFEPDYSEEIAEREALLAIFDDEAPENLDLSDQAFFEEEAIDFSQTEDEVSEPTLNGGLPEHGLNLKELLAQLEVDMICQALEQQDGVVARAAEQLQMRRTTLVEKMRKYGLNKDNA
ncbi:sigma-54-dependent Fis family transcriptional regulator [Alginatibacterium sediminis]|uniref:Sigma-54-dependent Fis family transcriptional regulator n=1 Tax=Alginatibacterium sediminis TaxID=2164068 RepID=A0A420EG16_9ALTE|nr:sigma-54 dependent transcriptional regulator [Alginatibacterium sediminis]RKF19652.1 sigma-54-dependent Fis family transcriptional regulator [Alginatibacterium sediminis]